MATDKPKVSAYVPQSIKDHVIEFQRQRDISESQALTIIIAEYFGISEVIDRVSDGAKVGGVTLDQLKKMQSEIIELKEKVESLINTQSILSSNLLSEPPQELTKKSEITEKVDLIEEKENTQETIVNGGSLLNLLSEPLSQNIKPIPGKVLCLRRLNISPSTISSKKKELTPKDFLDWVKTLDPDGISWEPTDKPLKGYKPSGSLTSEQESNLLKWMLENDIKQ
jgi:hypothetical protein